MLLSNGSVVDSPLIWNESRPAAQIEARHNREAKRLRYRVIPISCTECCVEVLINVIHHPSAARVLCWT